ncbi:DSRD domain protein [Enterococcus phage 53]|uniref:Uncharacterized protein n=2 Tax=Kochikohdavirus TaxID=2560160 RepID=A0AAE7RFE6_9CAUD|nr:hypothetical protein [Enterococcus phage MDA2]WDQ27717.1 DSRD domain protein [Enterococcus phage 53]
MWGFCLFQLHMKFYRCSAILVTEANKTKGFDP